MLPSSPRHNQDQEGIEHNMATDHDDAEQELIDSLLFEHEQQPSPDDTPQDDDPDEVFDTSELQAYDAALGRIDQAPTKRLTPEFAKYLQTQRLLSVAKVRALKPPRWFLHEVLPEAPLTILHGAGGTKKSFLMLDLMLHADAGLNWHDRPLVPGRCLYISGEGIAGTGKRIDAWCDFHEVDPDTLRMHFLAHPLDLYGLAHVNDKGEFPAAVEAWRAMVEAMHFDYIVVDTLHRNAPGADENSALDIGKVFSVAQRIAGEAHLFFIHHDPKEGKTARGSSSIHDDADVVLRITEKDDHTSTLHSEKLRDAEDFKPIDLHFFKDRILDTLVIDTVEQWKPKTSKRQEIINTLRAEPKLLTQADVLCVVGKASHTVFKKLQADKIIVSEVRASNKPRGPRMVDVWFVDEAKLAEDPDEEFQLDDD